MVEKKAKYCTLIKFELFTFFIPFLFTVSSYSQSVRIIDVELPSASVKNYKMGLESNNKGLIMSCLYFAGKYRIHEFSEDVLDIVLNSNNIDICEMAVWSLFQIGDDSCCKKASQFLSLHQSAELRNCCKFLAKIKDYDTSIIKTLEMAAK